MTNPVLALQAADTLADQLRHRRDHLAERTQLQAARASVIGWERSRDAAQARLDELAAAITGAEHESADIDRHRDRLNRQLKTVIAPREAEALQHELATLAERRSAVDDRELEALEAQVDVDTQLGQLLAAEASVRAEYAAADAAVAAAVAEIERELAAIEADHPALRSAVSPGLLARYDGLRGHQMVAAAALVGSRCDGCFLDLSNAELDEVRADAATTDGVTDCPQCGRLLVM